MLALCRFRGNWNVNGDGIEDWELHRVLQQEIRRLVAEDADHPLLTGARRVLDETESVITTFNANQAAQAAGYRIQDRHWRLADRLPPREAGGSAQRADGGDRGDCTAAGGGNVGQTRRQVNRGRTRRPRVQLYASTAFPIYLEGWRAEPSAG